MVEHIIVAGLLFGMFAGCFRRGATGITVATFIGGVVCLLLAVPGVIWLSLAALLGSAVICRLARVRPARYLVTGLLAVATAFGIITAGVYRSQQHKQELLAEYPPVSMDTRLAYEVLHAPSTAAPASANGHEAGSEVATAPGQQFEIEVESALRNWTGYKRESSLQSLARTHGDFVDEFARSQGFGVIRMRRLLPARREYIEIPELPRLPQGGAIEWSNGETPGIPLTNAGDSGQAPADQAPVPNTEILRQLHTAGRLDFINPLGFGYVASRDRVYGFQAHGFRDRPEVPVQHTESVRWQVASLELVSMLKHDPPAAYASKNLPRMDELVDAPTRPLNTFESGALARLKAGEEIVVEGNADEVRMLGSLRAARQCMQCHSVSRGEMLGAFTYRLRRDGAAPRPAAGQLKPVL